MVTSNYPSFKGLVACLEQQGDSQKHSKKVPTSILSDPQPSRTAEMRELPAHSTTDIGRPRHIDLHSTCLNIEGKRHNVVDAGHALAYLRHSKVEE